jgi:hypothetical protein
MSYEWIVAVFTASCFVVAGLAYKLYVLHNKQKHRSIRAQHLLFTQRQANKRLSKAIHIQKTPKATAQLAAGKTTTPNLLTMMNGTSLAASATPSTPVMPVFNAGTPVHNEENYQTMTVSVPTSTPTPTLATPTIAAPMTSTIESVVVAMATTNKLQQRITPLGVTDSPAIPSVVEVLKAHGSARDRLLQRRRQLLVKKKLPIRRKKLEMTPRARSHRHQESPHLDVLRKMR